MKKILVSLYKSIRQIGVVSFVLSLAFLSLVAIYTVQGWSEPTQAPPNGNVSLPINAGSDTQYKSGALGVGGVFRAYSSAIIGPNIDNIWGDLIVGSDSGDMVMGVSVGNAWINSLKKIVINGGLTVENNGDVVIANSLKFPDGTTQTTAGTTGGVSERIIQKVTRLTSTSCSTPNNEIHQCSREEALSNYTTDVDPYGSAECHPVRIECSMEYTTDSSNSIQIEINDPSNTHWECADYNLQDYCGDEDGCRVAYYGQHKTAGDDMVRGISMFMNMEQPSWSSNLGAGLYGHIQLHSGEYNWINGDGTADNVANLWEWTYIMNYYWSACGGNNTAFSNPYVFRFTTHPAIHSKYIIYDKAD